LTLGGVVYTKAELLALLEASPAGDVSLILVHQLIAAELNVAAGANEASIAKAIADADAWLQANQDKDGRLPFGVHASACSSSPTWISEILDRYNNGLLGVPHCG
jgi:hypothetical protein